MIKKKITKSKYKGGGFSDDEKRQIQQLVDFTTYAEIGRQLNRNPHSVRKYCQRNGLSKDLASSKKQVENKAKHNHHFKEMQQQLTRDEYNFAVHTYMGLMQQFGNDIIYSEEIQIIEYCMVTCLLNRTLKKEMELTEQIQAEIKLRSELEEKKDRLITSRFGGDDEDEEDEGKTTGDTYEEEDRYIDRIEQADIRISELQNQHIVNKKHQIDFLDRKEKVTKALNVSREQRAKELTRANQNFGDLLVRLKKDQEYRKTVGLELAKMKLGIKEEYLRLSDMHHFMDGQDDFPIYNSEVALRFAEKELLENQEEEIEEENEDLSN